MKDDPTRNLRHVIAQNWVPAIIAASGTVIAAVVAVLLTTTLNDDNGGGQVQPPAATVAPNQTAEPTGGASQTPTPGPGDTAAPDGPANGILAAPWTFTYTVTYNDCGFGTPVGELASANLTFREARPENGFIEDLEPAAVYAPDGSHVGDFVFHWPTWTFDTPLAGGGQATVSFSFLASNTADSSREETHTDGAGNTCRIVMQN